MARRIVVLDGYTLNPGDIDWGPFEAIGQVTVHDRTADDQIVCRAAGAACVLTNKTPLSAHMLAQLPQLRYIGVLATGYNIVDVEAANQRNIVVTNVPTYGTDSVAQHATALLLELARRVSIHNRAVHEGKWSTSADWCFALAPITELTGLTLGVVGLGRIGLAVARIAAAMGMNIIAFDTHQLSPNELDGLQIEYKSIDEVFSESDAISLHCPLTDQTHHLVNAERLAMMKPTAVLINTSRGPLVDNDALARALRDGTIGGAGLDVLDVEPPAADNPLIGLPNCIITPHLAWYAQAARKRLMNIAAENLKAFVRGNPINVVN
ncbi:MAG: D-2-hydroxyacid dehydrogenase [Phycisphaeraceae bacterium]